MRKLSLQADLLVIRAILAAATREQIARLMNDIFETPEQG